MLSSSLLDRKIHPDLNSLVEDGFSTEIPFQSSDADPQSISRGEPAARLQWQHQAVAETSDLQISPSSPCLKEIPSGSTSSEELSRDTFGQVKDAKKNASAGQTVEHTPTDFATSDMSLAHSRDSSNKHMEERNAILSSPHNTFGCPSPVTHSYESKGENASHLSEMYPSDPASKYEPPVSAAGPSESCNPPNSKHSQQVDRRSVSPVIRQSSLSSISSRSASRKHSARMPSITNIADTWRLMPASHSTPRRARLLRKSNKRRLSAEYSAMRATSFIGCESWESQVAQEIIRMSVTEAALGSVYKQDNVPSIKGNTRGSITAINFGLPFLRTTQTGYFPATSQDNSHSDIVAARSPSVRGGIARMASDGLGPSLPTTSSNRTRTSSPSRVDPTSNVAPATSQLVPPSLSITTPTPEPSPISPTRHTFQSSIAAESSTSTPRVPSTPVVARPTSSYSQKGKRKAEEAGVDGGNTPPKEHKTTRATFAADPRPHRASGNSGSSRAPSSYHRKRARLSATTESRPSSRTSGEAHSRDATNTGSLSSRTSASYRPIPATYHPPQRAPSRRSLSQVSIPVSALISPHAPSVVHPNSFHMRDPRKPAPVQSTSWSLSLPLPGSGAGFENWTARGGSPPHAWLFFFGFIIFPIWWIAAFLKTPQTRRLGATEAEKGVVLDDPQVEFDARSWRTRCRVMAFVSLLTYVPFIILVAVFAR